MRAPLPAFLAVLWGCAPPLVLPHGPWPAGETVVEVENLSSATVVVYVVTPSGPVPLGAVPGLGARRFRLPAPLVAAGHSLRLIASARGHEPSVSSPPFLVAEGQIVRWVLRHGVPVSDVIIH